MPLYDLFHRPLAEIHDWETLHTQWGGSIAADLNRRLPRRFLASAPMHLGPYVAADVVEREIVAAGPHRKPPGAADGNGAVAVASEPEVYAPPQPDSVMPAAFPDEFRVEVRDTLRGGRVLAVVELVSPGNKKEEDERVKFAAKCLSVLNKGIGLVVIDTVTDRHSNLHNELVRLARHETKYEMAGDTPVYVVAYRPAHRNNEDQIDLWHWSLTVGQPLPAVPLALKGFGCVRLDLESTYAEACERSRIP